MLCYFQSSLFCTERKISLLVKIVLEQNYQNYLIISVMGKQGL